MKSRAWFEKHGYLRQVRLYGPDGKLFRTDFPGNLRDQEVLVARYRGGFFAAAKKSKRITRIVVWAPEGDQKIEVRT